MIGLIVRSVLNVVDLVEAKGRDVREAIYRLVVAAVVSAAAVVLMLLGLVALLGALYVGLAEQLHSPAWALFFIGLVALVLAALVAVVSCHWMRCGGNGRRR